MVLQPTVSLVKSLPYRPHFQNRVNAREKSMRDNFNRPRSLSQNRVNAEGAAAAVAAERTAPDGVELLFRQVPATALFRMHPESV